MRFPLLIGAALVAASTLVHAQAPQGEAPKARRFDCSQAKDPKACEDRRAKAKDMHAKALKACEELHDYNRPPQQASRADGRRSAP